MKAAILRELHQPLVLEDIPKPVPGRGEVLIRLKAAALNHRDVWLRKGLYPGAKVPAILGSDGAGVVEEVGDADLESWLGKSVVINPAHNWGPSSSHYGPDFRILGLEDDGTFAQYVKVNATYLHEKPSYLTYEQAAAIPLAGLTAWRSLISRAGFREGEKVLITGIGGGVAQFVLLFAVALGGAVWVTSGSEEKINRAIASGAKGGFNYKNPDWFKEVVQIPGATKRGFFDVIIDSAGGTGFNRLIDVAAPGGRICFYGGTLGNITDLLPAKIFFKQLSIMGSTMGSPGEFREMMSFIKDKQLIPVIDRVIPLEEIETGLELMERGDQFGKIVFRIS